MESIRTYTEQVEDKESLGAIRKAIAEAKVIVLLGTAYHPNNMALLVGENSGFVEKTIYATRKGISDADLVVVNRELSKLCGKKVPSSTHQADYHFVEECRDLFKKYRMSMRQ